MVAGVGIHTDDERAGMRDDSHGDRRSFLQMDMVTVAKRPAPVREEITSGRICDEPRPAGSGSLLMRPPRWAGRCRPHRPEWTIQREDTASCGPIASRVTPETTRPISILASQSQTSPVSYTHLRAHETKANLVCRLLLEKKKKKKKNTT